MVKQVVYGTGRQEYRGAPHTPRDTTEGDVRARDRKNKGEKGRCFRKGKDR